MIPVDTQVFAFIRQTTWSEIFADWREREAHQQKWIDQSKSRGFDSWDEWRTKHIAPMKFDTRQWSLYRIVNPTQAVPGFYGGPFKTWREEYYRGDKPLTFAELAQLPKVQQNTDIQSMAKKFPSPTTIIGLFQNGRIVIGEGMHRCCAVALAAQAGREITADITIALTDFSEEDIPLLERVTKYS